jgi:hypothetical protein
MIIIGADYHPGFQQIAFVDTDTGEFQERRLQHREEASSNCSSESSRSNQRACPLASIPTRTFNFDSYRHLAGVTATRRLKNGLEYAQVGRLRIGLRGPILPA